MAKLVSNAETYHELSLGSFHEGEVEAALNRRAEQIYPGYLFSLFRYLVRSADDQRRTDFALVDVKYRSWWVGEVEMIGHDLYEHVLAQVRAFRDGYYNPDAVAKHLKQRNDALDEARLRMLVDSTRPQILVVANKHNDHWRNEIHREGAKFGVFEMFRSPHNQFIFRINGDVPVPQGTELTECSLDRSMPRLLKIHTPSAYQFTHGNKIEIEYNGVVSDWQTRVIAGMVWLKPVGGNDLDAEETYVLRTGEKQMLILDHQKRVRA